MSAYPPLVRGQLWCRWDQ